MKKSGVTEEYVRAVQGMRESCKTVVRCAVGETGEFKVPSCYYGDGQTDT